MRYIRTYENFKPIKVNNEKPFKVKKNIDKSIQFLQRRIKSLRKRLEVGKNPHKRKHSDMNRDKNTKIQQLKDLTFKQLKQNAYLRENPPVKESYDDESEKLLDVLTSPDFKPNNIENYIGVDKNKCELIDYSIDEDGFTLNIRNSELEKLMQIERGFIEYLLQITGYGDNVSHEVEYDELNYLCDFLSDELKKKILELAELFEYDVDDVDIDEHGTIKDIFEYLCLNDELDDFKREIEMEHERAIKKSGYSLLKKLPFKLNYEGTNILELVFKFSDIIKYINDHELDIKNIKELLENIYDASDFNYDFESEGKFDYLLYDNLESSVKNVVDKYILSPDEMFPKIIKHDDIDLFKKCIELADFTKKYDIWIEYNKFSSNLFEIAKAYNGEILKSIRISKNQEKIINRNVKVYQGLIDSELITPEVEKKYRYLIKKDSYRL